MTEEIILKTRSQQKTGISSDWEKAVNFIPLKGEIIVYSDLNKIKIGDGETNVNDLEFMQAETTSGTGSDSTAIGSGTASGENSTVIGSGTASGAGATVIGSGEASGTGATAIGSGTATGDYSVAEGADTLAGCMGYYIAAIDPASNQIYLHTGKDSVIPTWDNPSSYYDPTFNGGYRIYLGDVNDDGLLTAEDADLILQHVASGTLSDLQQKVADVNKSGDITAADNIQITQYLAGWDVDLEFIPYGNEFSISSDGYYHWVFAGNIVEISGNRITYGENNSLNNTDKWINENNKYDGQVDPMTFFIPAQPDCGTTNVGLGSHAEGWLTHAAAQHSHAEGEGSIAAGRYGHAEGRQTRAGFAAHAEGQNTLAKGLYSHAEGANTIAIGSGTHAEGSSAVAIGNNSHAEGSKVVALGVNSHAEGRATNKATDIIPNLSSDTSFDEIKTAWDENKFSLTIKEGSHVEGVNNIANAYGHAEGGQTIAKGAYSHAEGQKNIAGGTNSHVEGTENEANGNNSHAEGKLCFANGEDSHAEGLRSIANKKAQHVQGKYNIADTDNSSDYGKYAHIVGNGTKEDEYNADGTLKKQNRSNAYTLDWDGNAWFAGEVEALGLLSKGPVHGADGHFSTLIDTPVIQDGEGYSIAVKNIALKSDLPTEGLELIGQKTTENGEIFNNYESNTAAKFAHAEGNQTKAEGVSSHAEGYKTTAKSEGAHAEGTAHQTNDNCMGPYADGKGAHAEGASTTAIGKGTHAEGRSTNSAIKIIPTLSENTNFNDIKAAWDKDKFLLAIKESAHAEGVNTIAYQYGHAEGGQTIAKGQYSHAEGQKTQANGTNSHAEGKETISSGANSHAEGNKTTASGENAHAEGGLIKLITIKPESGNTDATQTFYTVASGKNSHAEGCGTAATNTGAHAEGGAEAFDSEFNDQLINTVASGEFSHAEGVATSAENYGAHSEGVGGRATGCGAHVEGYYAFTQQFGQFANLASGIGSHAEGVYTQAYGYASHTEGGGAPDIGDEYQATTAYGNYSHAEGYMTQAGDYYSKKGVGAHTEGLGIPLNMCAGEIEIETKDCVFNCTTARGDGSHAEGLYTIAYGDYQHVQGRFNEVDYDEKYAHIVGNGNYNEEERTVIPSNAHTLDWDGNAWFAGNITVGEDKKELATKEYVDSKMGGSSCSVEDVLDYISENGITSFADIVTFGDVNCYNLNSEAEVTAMTDITSVMGSVNTNKISTVDGSISFNTKDIVTKDIITKNDGYAFIDSELIVNDTISCENSMAIANDLTVHGGIFQGAEAVATCSYVDNKVNGSEGTITVPIPGTSTAALRMLVADSQGNMSWVEIQRAEDVSV